MNLSSINGRGLGGKAKILSLKCLVDIEKLNIIIFVGIDDGGFDGYCSVGEIFSSDYVLDVNVVGISRGLISSFMRKLNIENYFSSVFFCGLKFFAIN